ncbi:SdpI/YhfL protein family protein [uncultured archaeon]|nr:SdpI/YhfL protein family protein [uncultured archaeon]
MPKISIAGITLALILLAIFGVTIFLYNSLPEKMVTHWGADGQPNGYSGKLFGAFIVPVLSLALVLLFAAIPVLDPLRGIEKFRAEYDKLPIVFALFMLYVQGIIISSNLGFAFNSGQLLAPAIGLLFIFIGNLLGKAKRNWFVGIRTPWTMSSEKVWDKTHRLGEKMFTASGIIAILGALDGQHAMFFVLVPVLVSAAILVAYSFIEYKKDTAK